MAQTQTYIVHSKADQLGPEREVEEGAPDGRATPPCKHLPPALILPEGHQPSRDGLTDVRKLDDPLYHLSSAALEGCRVLCGVPCNLRPDLPVAILQRAVWPVSPQEEIYLRRQRV